VQARLGRHREAVSDFSQALKLDPNNVVARHGRASSLTMLGEPGRAIEDLDEVLRIDPGYVSALLARGEAQARAGRNREALKDYSAYLSANPEDAYGRFRRGLAFTRLDRDEEAVADFGEAIRLDARLLSAYLERGRAYERLGRADRAVLDLAEAAELAPRFAPAHNELAWLLATARDDAVRDGKKALEHARTAAELSGWTNAGVLDTYAAALAEAGDLAEAVSWQQKALELPGFSAKAREEAQRRLALYRAGKAYRAP
jgi:tetratricopeptide (TPR) repeat protein